MAFLDSAVPLEHESDELVAISLAVAEEPPKAAIDVCKMYADEKLRERSKGRTRRTIESAVAQLSATAPHQT
jgi:hypothetical protein